MSSLEEFANILKKIDKNKVSKDFMKKEKESFTKIEEETKEFYENSKMSYEQYHKEFNI